MSTITEISGFSRALSDLHESNHFLDQDSFVEISRKTGENSYESFKTPLKHIGDALIDQYNLYVNLNNIFNSTEYPNATYFSKTAYFRKNPYVATKNDFPVSSSTKYYMTKSEIDEYLKTAGICVPINRPGSRYFYYSADAKMWIADDAKKPVVLSSTMDGIWTSKSKLKFNYGHSLYAYTEDVKAPKNIMLDVTGNIVLDSNYEDDWYESQISYVALTIDGNVATLVFLKNIVEIKDDSGKEYVVAQFHFHCPIAAGTTFKIVTNANCKLFGLPDKDVFSRKLYDSLNAVNLSYYDSWS